MTPLVLLHGFTGSPASWDEVVRALPGASTTRLTLLGHGADSPETERVRTFEDELARLLALLPPEPVHLAGYSLGARLALGLALTAPERIARLTLVSGQPGLTSDLARAERRRSDAAWCELLETRGIEAFVDAWEAQPLFASESRLQASLRGLRRQQRLRHDPHGLARSLRATGLGEMPDYGRRLPSVTLPVTVMAGELDAKFLALGRDMTDRLPNGRLVVAPNAGHDLLLERPDLVALGLRDA